jgi:glycerate kinase
VKILIAMDKFKGSLSASEAGEAVKCGLLRVWPRAEFDVVPVADGGDGTLVALVDALGGAVVKREVRGPDGKQVRSAFALLDPDRSRAVVELARASGLALMPAGANDPLTATTYGTGELIGAAIDAGARTVLLAIGGSATNDAGTGALSALGARFLDESGADLPAGGAALVRLARIDLARLETRLSGVSIDIASDVDNPLCGPNGASAVYGPQKGASPKQVRQLDDALTRFAEVAAATTGAKVRDVPGAGAAGGVAGGFLALAGARLVPGASLVLETIGFERRLDGVDLVVTGEGKLDRQTLAGKAPHAVARAARERGIPVVAIAGSVDLGAAEFETLGIATAASIVPGPMSVEEAMMRASDLTADAAERLARAIDIDALEVFRKA